MTNWLDDIDDDTGWVALRREARGKMPVGSQSRARAAGKSTYASKRARKRAARAGGIKNRRHKRCD